MKTLHRSLLLLPLIATATMAQETTSPVGFNTVTALGSSDTRLSAPLQRHAVYQGVVQSVAGNEITVQGLPGWTLNQFLYVSGSQPNTYYVTPTTGNKKGMFYTLTANSADSGTANTTTVTVDAAGDTLDTGSGILSGDALSIIPFWTLDTMFPGQAGITGTTAILGTGAVTQILVTDPTTVGTDLASSRTYYYFTGSTFGGPGWRMISGGFTSIKNDDVILPDLPIIVRQNNVPTSQITVVGSVPASDRKYIIGTLQANQDQDNNIAVDIPVPMTLTQSNLYQSGAFLGTSNIFGVGGDKLLVFNDAVTGYDKSANFTYYYFTGTTNGGEGWRRVGGGFSTIRDNDVIFQPGSGYVVRKIATPTPSTAVWSIPLPY
ncbi:MAG: TIGR02597 family protein [Prosthecobacter sp.]|uniref:TIGR02597 family protein n=1 Tax=Prosthecobacter sp. TaxID=1965333 RepID=UPI00261A6400|nr:TIGR02597 family protein [Prosthecobacter sp.]MCF7790207.1 TIGR02597 family protein [Prosthecobacter sp.]